MRRAVEVHYDTLAFLYRAFWGDHIHHGLWLRPNDSPRRAQLQLVEHLAHRAGIQRQEHVLDVGCGYAAPSRWLARHLACRITAITISGAQVSLARRLNAQAHLEDRIALVRTDAAQAPFADGSFDLVWVIECLEHLTDKGSFISQAARMLRPGGRLALCSWLRGPETGPEDALVRTVCESFLCPSLASQGEYHSWCAAAGLEVRCVEDLTARVTRTWEILVRRLSRPWLWPVKRIAGGDVRRFVDGFAKILEAYESGAMSYGLLVAGR